MSSTSHPKPKGRLNARQAELSALVMETDRRFSSVYSRLRASAQKLLAGKISSLSATALVHEGYVRIRQGSGQQWNKTAHFCAAAVIAMRRTLVERFRCRRSIKRGGDQRRVTLTPEIAAEARVVDHYLDIDAALVKLQEIDFAMAQVVELRYFAGMTVPETAAMLSISPRAVNRRWAAARVWLQDELEPDVGGLGAGRTETHGKSDGTLHS